MGNFFAELKRRHIYRVAATYVVVAWILIQVVNNLAPMLRLPDWAGTLVVVLLLVGFPVTLIFAWIHQLASDEDASLRASTGALDWLIAGGLAAVMAIFAYQQLSVGARNAQATVSQPAGISIAVLPLANLSGDATQEFFSDGMTDEIIAALAKVPSLQVVARTSAFQFKGEKKDMRAIGQALNARYLIDGSVRKAGDRVRITAQLVQADSGVGVWTESYDREMKDIFVTQSDIAQAIVGALRVPLGLAQGQSLVYNRTVDLESYEEYLRGRTLFRSRVAGDAAAVLEVVAAREPDFAPAWAVLAAAYLVGPTYDTSAAISGNLTELGKLYQSATDKAEKAAREAIRLDPKNAMAISALGDVELNRGRWAAAEDYYKQALALDPIEPDALLRYMIRLGQMGRFKDAFRLMQRLRTAEPFVPAYNIFNSWIMYENGQTTEAIALIEAVPSGAAGGYFRNQILALFYAHEGRFQEAADTLLAIPPRQNTVSRVAVENAARLMRNRSQETKTPEALPALDGLSMFYVYLGAPDRLLESHERTVDARLFSIWAPPLGTEFATLHKSERFKALMRRGGLVDYWKARGWPDMCRPQGADDFVCD